MMIAGIGGWKKLSLARWRYK